jgi:hypothetical protein
MTHSFSRNGEVTVARIAQDVPYDGSLNIPRGDTKLPHRNTFVVAAVIVTLPFLDRPLRCPS